MDPTKSWEHEFEERLKDFKKDRANDGRSVSIKIRVVSGCFHREHSPRAYEMIDKHLRGASHDWRYLEHESGPELLVWLALGTAGITLAKSVVEMVTAIIKARSEGIKAGDTAREPVEVIVRSMNADGTVREERVLRFAPDDPVVAQQIAQALNAGAARVLPPAVTAPKLPRRKNKKRRK